MAPSGGSTAGRRASAAVEALARPPIDGRRKGGFSLLSVGDVAPDFELPSSEGGTVRLSEAVERGPVVLHFFLFAFTGG